MKPTDEMIEAVAAKFRPMFSAEMAEGLAKKVLTAALTLLPGEPLGYVTSSVAEDLQSGNHRIATFSATRDGNYVVPLYTCPTPHFSVNREALLEEAREAMLRMEWAAEQLASTRNMEVYDAMIKGAQTDAMLEFDNARRAARDLLRKLEGSSNAKA